LKTNLALVLFMGLPTYLLAQNATLSGTVKDKATLKP